jgi:hypothetical protein
MKYQELKDFSIKNIPNVIYDDKIFKSYVYTDLIASKYCHKDPNYNALYDEVRNEISKRSKSALALFDNYLNSPCFKGQNLEYYNLCLVYDYLAFTQPQEHFTEDQKIVKNVLIELNANKRLIDIHLENKNVQVCFTHQLISHFYEEMNKIKNNSEDKKKIILFSGHDLYLTCLCMFLEVDLKKYSYDFDDEINFIIFKKKNDSKLYFKAEYNDELMDLPFDNLENKKICELDAILEKIKKDFLFTTYEEIMDICHMKSNKEFYPSN